MKKLVITSIFFISSFYIYPQWTQQNSGTTNRFLTCFFLNENIGWAAGNYGTIVKTTNGGQNWFSQSVSTQDFIHSIFFVDSLNGWIALYEFVPDRHGVIMRTTNGGQSWSTQHSVWSVTLHRVFFTDVNNGYALGSNGYLLKTTNGGQNWIDISPFYDSWLYSAHFFNPNVGWIGGGLEGYLLRTTNGGQNWSWMHVPATERIMCNYFLDEKHGWTCGANGKIIRTNNGGLDWLLGNSGVNVELRDIRFINETEGWSVGLSGRIIHTVDGGANWVQQYSGTNNNLFGVYFADNQDGWVVGDNGIILKTDNGGIPVELISFTGVVELENVLLKWSTASEFNNYGFDIERSDDKIKWNKIGFIEGNGTTTERKDYSYTDNLSAVNSIRLYYRLKQLDFDGTFEYSGVVQIENIYSIEFGLEQNYPNPFNPITRIKFRLPVNSKVSLKLYDVLGEEIMTILQDEFTGGNHEVEFNNPNLGSGIYFYKLEALGEDGSNYNAVKKMMIVK